MYPRVGHYQESGSNRRFRCLRQVSVDKIDIDNFGTFFEVRWSTMGLVMNG